MTWPGNKIQAHGTLANTLIILPMVQYVNPISSWTKKNEVKYFNIFENITVFEDLILRKNRIAYKVIMDYN